MNYYFAKSILLIIAATAATTTVSADIAGVAKSTESFNDALDHYTHDTVSDSYNYHPTSIVDDKDSDYSLDDYDDYEDYSMDEDEDEDEDEDYYSDPADADEYEYGGDGDEPPAPELEVGDVSYLAFRKKGGNFNRNNQCFRRTRNIRFFRNHRRFNFKLESRHDRKCTDSHKRLYEYGQFTNVGSFEQCARTCVNHVPSNLLNHFRGIDFNCHAKQCNCLFDKGTLNRRNGGKFNRIVTRNLNGRGRVRNLRFAKDFACGSVSVH